MDKLQEDLIEAVKVDKKKLESLIDKIADSIDPSYGDNNPEPYLKKIEQEFGSKIANQIRDGLSIMVWGRGHKVYGKDPLDRPKSRITKSNKINKTDLIRLKNQIKANLKEVADDYVVDDKEEGELPDEEQVFVDLHKIAVTPHPVAGDDHFKALRTKYKPHPGGEEEERNGERTSPKQGKSFKSLRIESFKEDLDEAVEISHERYMRSHARKAKDPGHSASWMFTHKPYGQPESHEIFHHHGRLSDAKKAAQKWAKERGHHAMYVMEQFDYTLEEVSSGSFTLKSGETVKLSESDASAINSVLASLSASNKKKMEEELTRDKQSFSKIVQFARKAGD